MTSQHVRTDGPVFASYRQSDGSCFADSIASLLRAAGIPVWRDVTDLSSGDTERRLREALDAGLSGAVVVVTPDVAGSSSIGKGSAVKFRVASLHWPVLRVRNSQTAADQVTRP